MSHSSKNSCSFVIGWQQSEIVRRLQREFDRNVTKCVFFFLLFFLFPLQIATREREREERRKARQEERDKEDEERKERQQQREKERELEREKEKRERETEKQRSRSPRNRRRERSRSRSRGPRRRWVEQWRIRLTTSLLWDLFIILHILFVLFWLVQLESSYSYTSSPFPWVRFCSHWVANQQNLTNHWNELIWSKVMLFGRYCCIRTRLN